MNQTQINKLRMYRATDKVMDDNQDLIEPREELKTEHANLKANLQLIEKYSTVQETDNTGITVNKTDIKIELTSAIYRLSAVLAAYSTARKDSELREKVLYRLSDLKRAKDSVLYDIGNLLVGIATPLITDLAGYFYTPDQLTTLNTLLTDFHTILPKSRVVTSVSKVSTLNISEVFRGTDNLLKNRMDVYMETFRFDYPDFYQAYKNARLIVNYGGGRNSGNTTDTGGDATVE